MSRASSSGRGRRRPIDDASKVMRSTPGGEGPPSRPGLLGRRRLQSVGLTGQSRAGMPTGSGSRWPLIRKESRVSPTTRYYEDLAVGQRFRTATVTVDAPMIRAFAAEFDPQPFHLDDDAARTTFFGGLVASGWHTAALSMRLLVDGELRVV